MLRQYFLTAWRNVKKNKGFSLINIFGMATGLTCFILICLYVSDELRYDRYAAHADRIYRINLTVRANERMVTYPHVDYAVGEGMKRYFPEIADFARVSSPKSDYVKFGGNQFREDKLAYTDSNFLNFFSIPLLQGNPKEALVRPNSMVLSKSFAYKYFGGSNPIGKTLLVGLKNTPYTVTGVFDQVPEHSHFHFDAFISYSTFNIQNSTWTNLGYYTYVLLNKTTDAKKLEKRFPELVEKFVIPEVANHTGKTLTEARGEINRFLFTLQPLIEIHLHSHTQFELEPNGDIKYVYLFSALGLFILLLACINFTNLSIAISSRRTREISVRKVLGSSRLALIRQFLSESVLLSLCAMILSLALLTVLLPKFDQITGKHITLPELFSYPVAMGTLGLTVFVGLLSGVYPALFLSSSNPAAIFKGTFSKGPQRKTMRNLLIAFQFFVSATLLTATAIIFQQLQHLQNQKPGFEKDQVLFIPDARLLGNNQEAFRQQLLNDSRVVAASISRSVPGDPYMNGTEIYPENTGGNTQTIHADIFQVDYEYLHALGIPIKQGRFFSNSFTADSAGAVVINEAAVNDLGWANSNPIGRYILRPGLPELKVIGVVHDFQYVSAKQKTAPLLMMLGQNSGGLIVKIRTPVMHRFISDLKQAWTNYAPAGSLSYTFIDEKFNALYNGESRTREIFTLFSLIAIIIAVMGLLGLSAYEMELRTKEMSIRKVLGASVPGILWQLSRDFLSIVTLAFLLSIPVTWWAMNTWLQDYAYRISIGWPLFAFAGMASLLMASIAILFHAIKTATVNPAVILRSEA